MRITFVNLSEANSSPALFNLTIAYTTWNYIYVVHLAPLTGASVRQSRSLVTNNSAGLHPVSTNDHIKINK